MFSEEIITNVINKGIEFCASISSNHTRLFCYSVGLHDSHLTLGWGCSTCWVSFSQRFYVNLAALSQRICSFVIFCLMILFKKALSDLDKPINPMSNVVKKPQVKMMMILLVVLFAVKYFRYRGIGRASRVTTMIGLRTSETNFLIERDTFCLR